jgi:tetratricopeptide (TPR) repeat protein
MSRIVKKLNIEDESTLAESGQNLRLLPQVDEEKAVTGSPQIKKAKSRSLTFPFVLTVSLLGSGVYLYFGHVFRGLNPSSSISPKITMGASEAGAEINADERDHLDALRLFRSKDYGKAYAKFDQIYKKHPDDAGILNNLGLTFLKLNDYKRAESEFKKALKIEAKDGAAYNNLGTLMLTQNSFDDAIAYFYQAILYHPEMLEPHLNLAKAFELSGRPMEAIPEYHYYLDHAGVNVDPEVKKLIESRILKLNTYAH